MPYQKHGCHTQYGEQPVLETVHLQHQPVFVFCADAAQINPKRHGNQRGKAVHLQPLPKGNAAAHAGGKKNGAAQAGQETGHEQHAVAILVEFFLYLGIAFGRHQARADFGAQNAFAIMPAEQEHQPVAHQHARHAHGKHDMDVGIAQTGNHSAGHQRHVFRNRNAEAAQHQYPKNREITELLEKSF